MNPASPKNFVLGVLIGIFAFLFCFVPMELNLLTSWAFVPELPILTPANPSSIIEEMQPQYYPAFPVEKGLGDRYILVSLQDQQLFAYERGERILEAVVSTGKASTPTPKGVFSIRNKAPRAYSRVAGLYMPFWMAFHHDGKYWLGFHELPEWGNGIKEGEDHLGQPYSGGCIRIGVGTAEKLYNWAELGDQILIY